VQRAPGFPRALKGRAAFSAERFSHDSGASRREIIRVRVSRLSSAVLKLNQHEKTAAPESRRGRDLERIRLTAYSALLTSLMRGFEASIRPR
jgi:hypothetical protein